MNADDRPTADVVDELVAAAVAGGGGRPDVPFLATLELLVESCRRTGRLNATGREVLYRAAVRHLRTLVDLAAHVDAHPDVAGRSLGSPVVVTGLPRTATTLLHNLLALDPAFRVLRFWEALRPVPPPPGRPPGEEPRQRAARWLDSFYRLVPGFRAIHPSTPDGPEECDALLQNTFASQHFDDMFDAREYSSWLATAPLADEYASYALQLRVLSASTPPGTAWALKSPGHLGHLDALLAALPGATVVWCHRDPAAAVASWASLVHTLRRAYSDDVSPADVGRSALQRAATAVHRAVAVRAQQAEAAFVDVAYRDLVADPVAAVAAVYDRLGRPLSPTVAADMAAWVAANPAGGHGAHRYALADFGLSAADVEDAFGPYLERGGELSSGP
ncbi:MAG: sulfotransferase [Acidimicrobiales bacterium]